MDVYLITPPPQSSNSLEAFKQGGVVVKGLVDGSVRSFTHASTGVSFSSFLDRL